MNEVDVSIIIPVKNGANTIRDLLESLMKLEYDRKKYEVIVVDGYSTDGTRELVLKYPVKLVMQEGDGLNAARNTGVKNSKGRIIAFTDADCIVPRDWVKNIVSCFKDDDVACIGGSVKGLSKSFTSIYVDNTGLHIMPRYKKQKTLNLWRVFSYPAGCNIAFRRDLLINIGLFNEAIKYGYDDLELIERLGLNGYKIRLEPNVIVFHQHRNSIIKLIKQTYRYGRGAGILIRKVKGARPLKIWLILYLIGFIVAITLLIVLLITGILFNNKLSLDIIKIIVLTPLTWGLIYYFVKGLKKRILKYALAYPIIDLLVILSSAIGELQQLLRGKLNNHDDDTL
jgi:glycosyltransferase involved in cell wall biosynthesis